MISFQTKSYFLVFILLNLWLRGGGVARQLTFLLSKRLAATRLSFGGRNLRQTLALLEPACLSNAGHETEPRRAPLETPYD
ncbi:hypothetical protein ACW7AA_26535 [Azospirillum argentinense]